MSNNSYVYDWSCMACMSSHSENHTCKEKPLDTKSTSTGIKHDGDKPRWDLLPYREIEDIVNVLTFGSKKYEDDNWKKIENIQPRYFAAAMRHLVAHKSGEILDKESKLPHLSHAMCCLLFMAWDNNNEETK